MNIGKKLAVLTVAAGALVLGSAGGASAHGFGGFDPFGAIQTNSCDTAVGPIVNTAVGATTGDISFSGNCLNYTQGTAAIQANDCDTSTGLVTNIGGLASSGDITGGSNCTNIALGNAGGYGGGYGRG
ncbi:hypothetical protein [Streptomyces sp. NBRC 110028]|uniref:hypothetical protein n=1 Tax=Streptomyces sp. NBRC 110028 TaxID=1621260 RepID=UPI0006E41513|nr:hypothetical protein [Streptomyces sp. NBRC 110028]